MGVTTSFFAATIEELQAVAPGWVVARYGAYRTVERVNGFTGAKVRVKDFELLSKQPRKCKEATFHDLIPSERAFAWKLPGSELKDLMKLLTDAKEVQLAELDRLAMIGPDDAEYWVHELPEAFVQALATLEDKLVTRTAAQWNKTVKWNKPPKLLLQELIDVAREATAANRRMFSYVSL